MCGLCRFPQLYIFHSGQIHTSRGLRTFQSPDNLTKSGSMAPQV